MPDESALREHLLALLEKENAHAGFEKGVKDMPYELQGKRPQGSAHSPWEILEHMRIAQWDILEFVRNPEHVSPEFPKGYWPKTQAPPDAEAWNKSVNAFRKDLNEIKKLVTNEATDLFARVPHGDGQTILREVLVVAAHNAYHLGELILLRRLVGAWR